jgi:AraC family transcriptional regulator of adaptative response / DNA-3-methyladenine glycosylase II
VTDGGPVTRLALPFTPPLDWPTLLAFVARRCTAGLEQVEDGRYRRTVRVGSRGGWVTVALDPGRPVLHVELAPALAPVRDAVATRLRSLFDLDADPAVIAKALGRDRLLAPSVRRDPGLRVPGAFDGFDAAVRVVVGQQVSVAAATTIAGRLARGLGASVETPFEALDRLSPTPEAIVAAGEDRIAGLGMPGARARTLVALAGAVLEGSVVLERGAPLEETRARLLALPGIGPWTADVIAMRALGAADAFPAGDLGVLRALGTKSIRAAEARAEAWRPWRAYAAMHLWQLL